MNGGLVLREGDGVFATASYAEGVDGEEEYKLEIENVGEGDAEFLVFDVDVE